jgi:hypothetical protein
MQTLQNYFSHPSLVIYFFLRTPPIKLKLRQQNRWATTNSKPAGPIIMMDKSEILCSSRIITITLISAGAQDCCAFYQPLQIMQVK